MNKEFPLDHDAHVTLGNVKHMLQERARLQKNEDALIIFFRDERPDEGFIGDEHNENPVECAIRVMRAQWQEILRYSKRVTELEALIKARPIGWTPEERRVIEPRCTCRAINSLVVCPIHGEERIPPSADATAGDARTSFALAAELIEVASWVAARTTTRDDERKLDVLHRVLRFLRGDDRGERIDVERLIRNDAACAAIAAHVMQSAARRDDAAGLSWSDVRSILQQGAAIQQDYAAGNHATYEHYAARMDEAAREIVAARSATHKPNEEK